MQTADTTPGKTYSVHTMKGCTIIAPDGWQKTIEAPDGYFDAHFGRVVIDGDDEASIKELFKLAPQQKLTLLGVLGGDKLPAGYTRLAYLESTGTQYIAIKDIQIDDDLGARCDYVDFNPIYDAPMLSGTRSTINVPRFYIPYTSNGTGYYGWNAWVNIGEHDNTKQRTVSLLNYFNNRTYKMSFGNTFLSGPLNRIMPIVNNQFLSLFCYNPNGASPRYVTGRVDSVQLTRSSVMVCSLVPALDQSGVPCMYDTVTGTPFYNSGSGAFIAGVENQAQLNNMLRKLPDRTGQDIGTLQVRLSDNLQTVENVAKLESVLAKNWEISQAA